MKKTKQPVPVWVPYVMTFVILIAVMFAINSKFIPIWMNFIPAIGVFVGAVISLSGRLWFRDRTSDFIYALGFCLSPAIVSVLLVNRFQDPRPPILLPAKFLQSNPGIAFAKSSVTISVTYPNGEEVHIPLDTSLVSSVPSKGRPGKAEIGQGRFGIQYFKAVNFND
jgi:hypothetical protein